MQKEHSALHAPALQVTVRGLAKGRAEGSDEMRPRHLRNLRELSNAERLRKSAIHRISRAQQATIALFYGCRSAHNLTLNAFIINQQMRQEFAMHWAVLSATRKEDIPSPLFWKAECRSS